MNLYTSIGPNPRIVHMFIAEKGVTIPTVSVDLMGGENRREPYTKINPAGQTPAFELDNGQVVTEIAAICEYLEEKFPAPALIGTTPEERAETRMWTGRVNLKICEPMTAGFQWGEGLALFQPRKRCVPEASPGMKAVAQDGFAWVDGLMGGRTYLCGDRFTYADINLYAFAAFGARVGQPMDPALKNLAAWFARVDARASAQATAG
jgi:glutathione S-transferase